MTNYTLESNKESMIRKMNSRVEATQTINPITGQPYLEDLNPKVKRLEDRLQARLRAMEERNPSANKHRQSLLKNIADRLYFIDRALQNRKGLIWIVKARTKIPKYGDFDSKDIYDKIINSKLDDLVNTYTKDTYMKDKYITE